MTTESAQAPLTIHRTQTGVRIESGILKVLRALADFHDMTLGDLLEGIVLHAFDGKAPFGEEGLQRIKDLKRIYGVSLDASHSHRLVEAEARAPRSPRKPRGKKGGQQ